MTTLYRPTSDVAVGGWSTAPLWSKIDDPTLDSSGDGDSISSPNTGATGYVGLGELAPVSYLGWRLRVRASTSAAGGYIDPGLVRQSDQGTLASTIPSLFNDFDTSLGYYEMAVNFDVDPTGESLTNYGIKLDPAGGVSTITVSAVEVEVPTDIGGLFSAPGFGDTFLSPNGRAGPWGVGTKRYMVTVDSDNWVWLWEADGPTNGHNPGEWTRIALIGGSWARISDGVKNTQLSATETVLTVDAIMNDQGDIIAFTYPDDNAAGTAISPVATVGVDGAPKSVGGFTQHFGFEGSSVSGYDRARIVERPNAAGDFRIIQHRTDRIRSLQTSTLGSTNTGTGKSLMDAVSADTRTHLFLINASGADTGALRHQSILNGHTMGTESGDIATGTARLGIATSYFDGANWQVVCPIVYTDGSGIDAAVFQSADTPTISTQTVTSRDAYDVSYEQSAIAVKMGTTVVIVWLDVADGESIRAASRDDGETTWTDLGTLVTGVAGRSRLSAMEVATDTIGLVTATTTGNIHYYEVELGASPPDPLPTSGSGWGIPVGI